MKLIKKILYRIFSPPNNQEKIFWNFIFYPFLLKRKIISKKNKANLLIWDIRTNSITFDIVYLLFEASIKFAKISESEFDVLIYFPKNFIPKIPSIKNYDKSVQKVELKERYKKIIIPIIKSNNCVKEIFYADDSCNARKIIDNYRNTIPKVYNPDFYSPQPQDMVFVYKNLLEKSSKNHIISKSIIQSKNFLKPKINGDNKYNYATLTLRDYGFSPSRNTTQKDIEKFLKFCNILNAQPIIVPDNLSKIKTYNINKKECFISKEARENIYERIDLYSKSIVNIFSPSGPGQLSLFVDSSKTILLNYGSGGIDGDINYYKKEGLLKNQQPFLSLGGFIIWKDKTKIYNVNDLKKAFYFLQNYLKKTSSITN